MDQAALATIQKLLEQLVAKPDGAIAAAAITVAGMLGAALIQWLVTLTVIRSEHQRLLEHLNRDFRLRQFEQWLTRFQETIADLLKETDPEVGKPNPERVNPLLHRAALMLNTKIPGHKEVNALVIELGLAANGWHGPQDARTILRLHGNLLEAARRITALPEEHERLARERV